MSTNQFVRQGDDGRWQRLGWAAIVFSVLFVLAACEQDEGYVDVTPPAIPNGLYSITADQQIILRWNPNREPDLAGYHILSNGDGGPKYTIIATIDAYDASYYKTGWATDDPGDDYLEYWDTGIRNGEYYWYAVIAFDDSGNESEMSLETVVDVPRPEGNLDLMDDATNPNGSGYDLSSLTNQAQPGSAPSTDVYFVRDGSGVGYLVVDSDRVRIQDYGNVGFDVATYAPTDGWSRVGRSEVIRGHTYILQIFETPDHVGRVNYAKVTVVEEYIGGINVDWGYQIVVGERELKRPGARSADPRKEQLS
jgi:hypothetical protein